jgi:hypothetical protein
MQRYLTRKVTKMTRTNISVLRISRRLETSTPVTTVREIIPVLTVSTLSSRNTVTASTHVGICFRRIQKTLEFSRRSKLNSPSLSRCNTFNSSRRRVRYRRPRRGRCASSTSMCSTIHAKYAVVNSRAITSCTSTESSAMRTRKSRRVASSAPRSRCPSRVQHRHQLRRRTSIITNNNRVRALVPPISSNIRPEPSGRGCS